MKRIATRDARIYWADCEPFQTHGSLKGTRTFCGYGRVDDTERAMLRAGMSSQINDDYTSRDIPTSPENPIIYYVYSYATPVAWVYKDGTRYVTEYSYSPTTSKQISMAWLGVPVADIRRSINAAHTY